MASSLWLWAPTLVVLATVLAGVWSLDSCAKNADGCSVPDILQGLSSYQSTFTPSCNKHDVCYGCGADYGICRDQCDSRFLWNMEAACQGEDSDCIVEAKIYHSMVRAFGRGRYKDINETEHYCSKPYVRGCL